MYTIPDPLRIACTECHRDMRVEFQMHSPSEDSVIVAAECDCGRIIGVVDGFLIHRLAKDGVPLIAHSIKHDPAIGDWAKQRIVHLRERMATYERWIGAATWANERPRKDPTP